MVDGGGAGAVPDDMIRVVPETGSTNADMLALAAAGAAEGSWLRAERQTAGKGRQGRAWESPVGNLYASTLVRLRADDPPAPTLALVAAVALAHVVDTAGCPAVRIKWPNDLMVDGAKVAGILLERSGDAIVIGYGLNVQSAPAIEGRATASLQGRIWPMPVTELFDMLIAETREWLHIWRTQGIEAIIRRWLQMGYDRGTALTARLPDGTVVDGLFEGLSAEGALMLRTPSGMELIHAGDVFLL